METAIRSESSVRFESFELNLRTGELYRNCLRVKLRGHPIDVLAILLEHPGELVTREALKKRLWPDNTFVDFEQILNNSIGKLRDALGDQADSPKFIETLPRLGYRFICPVEIGTASDRQTVPIPSDVIKPETAELKAHEQRSRKMLWRVVAAIGVLLTATAGLAWYSFRSMPTLRIASYTHIANVGQWAGIAGTDGLSLYLDLFLPNGNGVIPIFGGRVIPFPIDLPTSKDSPTDSPILMGVSQDGGKLLVGSNLDPSLGRKLWVVDAHGGGTRYLAIGYGAALSNHGKAVVYSTLHGDIYTISSQGGEPRLLLASTAPPGAPLPSASFVWSPDGKRIRFVRAARYWEISADGKNPHEILPNWHASNPRYFMAGGHWTPDGNFFVFLAGFAGFSQNLADARQLWALDERKSWPHRTNPEPVRLTNGATTWGAFAFSRDGKTVFCMGMSPRGELVRYDAKSRELVPHLGGISVEYVSYSKDGKYLVYVSYPEGTMWRANRDGSGLQQLTGPPFHPTAPEWSPDGTQILFSELEPSHRGEIYVISSQGGIPKRVLPGDKRWGTTPDWSPDGKRIVFDQSPVGTLFVANAIWVYQGGASRILDLETGHVSSLPPCPKPCFSPQWSPDGHYILELASNHKELYLLDLRTSQWSRLDPKLGAMNFPRWSRDGRSIYVQDTDLAGVVRSTDPGIYRVPVTGGRGEKLVNLKGFRGTGSLSVGWSDLDPDDTPLLLRNVGTYDIYALTLERN